MSNNPTNQQHIFSNFKTMENLNPRQSFQDGTEDEIVSFQDYMNDGTSGVFLKNKELQFIENDKSITVDNDYEDDNTLTGKHNNSKKLNNSQLERSNISNTNVNKANTLKKNSNAILMKYISDSSDFFERPINQGQNLVTFSNNMNPHSNGKNYIDGDFEDDNTPNNNLGDYIHSNVKNNNPLFSSDGLGIIQPLETKIEDNFILENNNEINLYTNSNNTFKNKNHFQIETFNFTFFSTIGNSLLSTQSFGLTQSKRKEKEFIELENNYNEVLNLLKYWQQFYLDIANIVTNKNQNKSTDENDYFSEEYRYTVIEEVKNLIKNAHCKVYNYFEPVQTENFFIKSVPIIKNYHIDNIITNFQVLTQIKQKIDKSNLNQKIQNQNLNKMFDYLQIINENSIFFEKKISIKIPKLLDYNDYYDELPPLQFSEREKIIQSKHQDKAKTKEISTIQNDSKTLTIEPLEIIPKIELVNEEIQTDFKPDIKPDINSKSSNKINLTNTTNFKFTKEKLKQDMHKIILNFISQPEKRNVSPSPIKRKNSNNKKFSVITHSSEAQTDFTLKNIQNLEILNKEYSIQLQRTQKEKDNLKKTYDKKVNDLTKEIEDAKVQIEKEKVKVREKEEDNKEEKEQIHSLTDSQNDNQVSYLPELIPPEQTYKIFMHAVKHFKYEETIYKSMIEEEDLQCLKNFVNKMEKYIEGTNIPCQKTTKMNTQSLKRIPNANKASTLKMYHENILNGLRPLVTPKNFNTQYNKNHFYSGKRNNSSFMKYKNAIKNIHDNN